MKVFILIRNSKLLYAFIESFLYRMKNIGTECIGGTGSIDYKDKDEFFFFLPVRI